MLARAGTAAEPTVHSTRSLTGVVDLIPVTRNSVHR